MSKSYRHLALAVSIMPLLATLKLFAYSETPSGLAEAAFRGDTQRVKNAIARGVSANWKDSEGKTLLTYAAIGGHEEMVAILLSLGADPNLDGASLQAACAAGHPKIARLLVDAGADVNSRAGAMGGTPLREACDLGDLQLAAFLLRKGADPNIGDRFGDTPLILAVHRKDDLVNLLLRSGAKSDMPDSGGYTPLMHAAREGKVQATKDLLAAGAQVDTPNPSNGVTALTLAASMGHAGLVRALLSAGADPNARATGGLGVTPLMAAARSGDLDSVKLLLKAKADATVEDALGHTALHYAAIGAGGPVLTLLKRAGGALDHQDARGETALFAAYRSRNQEAIQALLTLGASPLIRNLKGQQAQEVAE